MANTTSKTHVKGSPQHGTSNSYSPEYETPNKYVSAKCSVSKITPDSIRPYPKACPRKVSVTKKPRGREPGKLCILTETPEKIGLNN